MRNEVYFSHIERLVQAVLFTSEDKQEGIHAFVEKRKLDFKGR